MSINIIEHLVQTVSPAILGDKAGDSVRNELLKKAYAIFLARFMDKDVYADLATSTPSNNFLERLFPQANQRNDLIGKLAQEFNVSNDETLNLVSDSAPVAFAEVQNLAGTTPVVDFLGANLGSLASLIPTWAYALIPAGVLSLLNINPAVANVNHTQTTTHVQEHLVATPKPEESSGLPKWLLPLIALLILGGLAAMLLKGCGKDETAPRVQTADTVATAPASVASTTESVAIASVASTTDAMVVGSVPASTASAVAVAPVTDVVISTTEPSVYLDKGRLSFYFVTAKADLAPQAKDKLMESKLLDAVQQGKKIGISGYTDSTGNKAFNDELSEKRAKSVKQFLMDNGVPEAQIELIKPDDFVGAEGKTQEGRRVDVYLVDGPGVVTTTVASVTQ
ncbi:OmpA family protein [Moraxella boevrei]|uniref:OmpA family protein n=1 Tax=Faucicola boevrei TaxID=346665 RepID=UPI003734D005